MKSLLLLGIFLFFIQFSLGAFVGPTINQISNSSYAVNTSTLLNQTGGVIYTITMNSIEQNQRWKAYVGNVSGTLVLDDADGVSIFEWDLGTVSGEVYASRDNSVNFTGINCSWAHSDDITNRTAEENENAVLSHTRLDNISATFSTKDHNIMQVGDITIGADECYSVHPYINDSTNTFNLYDEVILFDSADITEGSIVYASRVENDIHGYRGDQDNTTYDFQMLLPDNGAAGATSTIGYYFYVELE